MGNPKEADPGKGKRAAGSRESHDIALLHGPTDDGKGARILRFKDGELSAGEVRPAVEGQPLAGRELVRLHGREGQPALCDVEVLYDAASETDGERNAGPPRVATQAYRRGWRQVFAKSGPDRSLN